jgi:RNA polymerase-binding transcription factor DksA
MNVSKSQQYYDRLNIRRNKVMMTLEHVQQEQRAIDESRDWIDRAAYESRVHLLDNLVNWYINEKARIEEALSRIRQGKFGVCIACHEPIEAERLKLAPDAAFCAACHAAREDLSRAVK